MKCAAFGRQPADPRLHDLPADAPQLVRVAPRIAVGGDAGGRQRRQPAALAGAVVEERAGRAHGQEVVQRGHQAEAAVAHDPHHRGRQRLGPRVQVDDGVERDRASPATRRMPWAASRFQMLWAAARSRLGSRHTSC